MQLYFVLLYFSVPIFLVNQLNASQPSITQPTSDTEKIELLKYAELELRNRVSALETNYRSEQEKVRSLGSLYTDVLLKLSDVQNEITFFLNKNGKLEIELFKINDVLKAFEKTNTSVESNSLKLSKLQKTVDNIVQSQQAPSLLRQTFPKCLDEIDTKIAAFEKNIIAIQNQLDTINKQLENQNSNTNSSLDKDLNDLKNRIVSLRWTVGSLCFFNLMFVAMFFYMNKDKIKIF